MKKILVIGGAGYVGTELCNKLASNKNYEITCLDTFWFRSKLSKKIKRIKRDIRNLKESDFKNFHTVIHLAYLSNDPLCELNGRDTWESGPLSTYYIMEACLKNKVKKFIFASSGSIYGLKKDKNVTENLGLDPITDYNKSKMICEKVIETYKKKLKIVILRPATVCGDSERLRLDVVLNLFCYQAFFKKEINILGGKQIRPLLHIKDMIGSYEFFIKKNITGTYNVGFENLSVEKIANSVKKIIPTKVKIKKSNDPRSYRMNSDKLIRVGFKQKYHHINAIIDLKKKFQSGFKPSKENWNLNWLIEEKVIKKSD
jgi:nucleoside-diphosphate-sugar epimerase